MSRKIECDYTGEVCTNQDCKIGRCIAEISDHAADLAKNGEKIRMLEAKAVEIAHRLLKKSLKGATEKRVTQLATHRSVVALAVKELDCERDFKKIAAAILFGKIRV